MTAADRLAAIEARANAATVGPWDTLWIDEAWLVFDEDSGEHIVASIDDDARDADDRQPQRDAEFIAHARADVPALVAALRAVLDEVAECRRAADSNEPIAERGGWQASGYMKAYRRAADRLEAAIDQHLGGES